MDEDRLAAALRSATDDVRVPRDLVRRAERAGRARLSRRRSAVTTLVVGVVVVTGGALVVPQIGSGGSGSASTSAAGGGSASSAADSGASSAAPAPPPAVPAPGSAQDPAPEDGSRAAVGGSAACDPPLTVDGTPAREGYATSVPAGGAVEITGAPLPCAPTPPGARYTLVLVPAGSGSRTILAQVVPAADGSFAARATVPASTPPGPARLSVEGSARELRPCPDAADCTRPDHGADLDVLPAGPALQPSAPPVEESP